MPWAPSHCPVAATYAPEGSDQTVSCEPVVEDVLSHRNGVHHALEERVEPTSITKVAEAREGVDVLIMEEFVLHARSRELEASKGNV